MRIASNLWIISAKGMPDVLASNTSPTVSGKGFRFHMEIEFRGIPKDILEFLKKPLEDTEVDFKPNTVIDDRLHAGKYVSLALTYISRDAATNRLNMSGLRWSFKAVPEIDTSDYVSMEGILTIKLADGDIIEFRDRGEAKRSPYGENDQLRKEATTDAFKRVVRFVGIG